jgi:putative aldouronate transport system permease protein
MLYYVLLIPGILYFIIWKYIPMVGLIMAFKDVSLADGMKGVFMQDWVGLRHFRRFFSSPFAGRVIGNTVWISFLQIFWGFPLPIILAVMMSELKSPKLARPIQTISYLPHFISWVVASGLILSLLTTNGGLVSEICKFFGVKPPIIIGNPKYFVTLLVASNIWKEVGWNTIIYLAAITSIDETLYEAGRIDGASRIQMVRHITIPSIAFIIAMMLTLQMGSILDAGFEQVLLLYSEATRGVGDIIDTYVYRVGLQTMEYSFATAVGLFKSVISLVVIVIVNKGVNRLGYEGVW